MKARRWALAGVIAATAAGAGAWAVFVRERPVPEPAYDAHREYEEHIAALEWGQDPRSALRHAWFDLQARSMAVYRAWEQIEPPRGYQVSSPAYALMSGDWNDPRLDTARRQLAAYESSLGLFAQAVRMGSPKRVHPISWIRDPLVERTPLTQVLEDATYSIDPPRLEFHSMAPAMAVRMRQALHRAADEALLRAAEDALLSVRALRGTLETVAGLIANSIESLLLSEFRYCSQEGVSAEGAAGLRSRVEQYAPLFDEAYERTLDVYRMSIHDEFWRLGVVMPRSEVVKASKDPYQDWDFFALSDTDFAPIIRWLCRADYDRTWPAIDAWFEAAVETSRRGAPPERGNPFDAVDTRRIQPLVDDYFNWMRGSTVSYARLRTERAATILALRLAEYKATNGRWPERLADAAPEAETFDPITGLAFEYGFEADESDAPERPFLRAPGTAAHYYPDGQGAWYFEEWREFLRPRRELTEDELERLPPPEIFDQPPLREIMEAGR